MNTSAHILLVEDNPQDAELTLLALETIGLTTEVETVNNGAEAIAYIKSQGKYEYRKKSTPLKLVMLDLKMPLINGFEVLASIREMESSACLPIVVFSSSAVVEDIERAYELGANSYIVKPIDFDEHAAAVTKVADYWLNINLTNTWSLQLPL